MGYSRFWLLLLLSSSTLAREGIDNNEQTSSCQLTSRFKTNRKYMYQYTTESRNGVVGTANLRNGPKVSCQVEIEVPQPCSFIMHTRDCALSEVSVINPQGDLVYRQATGSDAFKAAMEKNPLKFTMEEVTNVQLFPETDEPVNILNIKRGIVSALMVPFMEDKHYSHMSTVHGRCLTDYTVNARKDIDTDVTLVRDLSQCDQFYSRELANSPLALLQKLHRPISKLITSTQDCNYQFDHKGKHITTATCTEKHIYLPFSHEDSGMSSVVTQELSFQNSRRINKIFDVNPSQRKPLHFEDPDDKAPVQTKDAVLSSLRDLVALAGTGQGEKRTSLFHKLVSSLRVLRNETLSETVTEMFDMSGWLTWQALFQCGTPECTSAILQGIRTIDGVSLEVDALVYGLSLQANPDAARVRDMLSMAQYKQSKSIMYALANTVKKFHKGDVTSVVTDVAEFMKTLLNDCSGEILDDDYDFPADPKETSSLSFLVLRVVGVMGEAMQDVSPSLMNSVLQCAKKTDIPLPDQKAAIQALRLMNINDEIKDTLVEVYQDAQSPVEKRIAAYLVLMKNSDQALVRDIVNNVENMGDEQLKNFVVSHLNNIRNSNEPQMHQLREYIELALTDELPSPNTVFDGMSHNYKVDSPVGSVQSNIIFDSMDTLPKEVMLETTLKVFDYNYDIFEVGVEGTGFEPKIDALFGEKGFFPDSISKVMYWAGDKAQVLRKVLDRITPNRDRMKRQVPQDLLKDITTNIQKLIDDVRMSPSPEAIAFLRLLGNEIGYIKTSEMRKMAETLFMYYHVFVRVLPAQAFFALTSSTENEVFAHYIFMDNAFSLPTASGFPLKFSLAGVVTPGAKGGLTFSRPERGTRRTDLSFMPSVGLEFITQMGVHIPDYVNAGLEMHTNMYHESSLNAKVTMDNKQIKLSIPAPKSNTQLLTISNKLLSISSGQTIIVPSLVEDRTDSTDCQPLISGLKFCTIVRYSNATSLDQAPYYPLTGETRFALEIQPTGEVSEYTATITDVTLRGRHKVESLKLTLKAEGDDSSEVTISLKYNFNKNTLTSEVVIPNYDVEAGIKVAVTDSDAKGKKMRGITIDVTNRNIPQLTLIGRTRLDMMKDAMLQLQMVIPSLKADVSVTATLKKDEDVLMDLKTIVNISESSYQQKASLKYDDEKVELELKSDMNSDIQKLIPNIEDHHRQLQQFIDHMLDQQVAKTDMKLRHIVTKGIEAGHIWLDKLTARFPYLANLRSKRSVSDLTLPALPEKLFLQSDSLFRYQFNKEKMAFSLPLPHGGKKLKELNIPTTVSIPLIDLPAIGLHIPAKNYPLPSFTIPPSLDLTVPLLGLAEASTKISSNFYNWEGSISGGNNTIDVPSYIAQYKAMAQSPFNLLSYKLEGIAMMSGRADDNLKYHLNSSFSHSLIDASISVLEMLRVTNKLNAKANYKIEASSPLGLQASLFYSAQSTSTLNSDEVSGDGTVDGLLEIGSFSTNASYIHSYNLRPLDREGRGESTLHFNSPFLQVHNMIHGVYANSELNIVSKTNAQNDILKHVAEIKYKDAQLTIKCNAIATPMGKSLNNKVELGVSSNMAILRIESQADDDTNRAYSLITGSLDSNGLKVNSEASLSLDSGPRGMHKASVMIGRNGLITSGTNSIQCISVTMENIFNGAIDNSGAALSSTIKAMAEESRGELNIEGKITAEEASLYGVLKGHAYDASTRNNMNIVLNRRALTFTSDTMGTLKHISTENSHTLKVTLWTLALRSKTNNIICEDIYYKQDIKVDMKPFVMSFDMTNDLKLYDVGLNNEGHMKLEPIKVDLSGSMSGTYGDDHNIKNIYELKYDDLAGAMKYSMSGNVMDAQLSHNCDLEFAGLSSKSNCEARINSEPLRFDSTIRTMALPFSLTVDALVNSDGEIDLYGKHTGQLYSKLLVKVEPLALAYSHDSRVSTTHMLPSGESSTNLDNKFDGLLTPSHQSLTLKVKSKLNNNAFDQDISAYNNPEQIGFEFLGVMLTDMFSKLNKNKRSLPDMQEFIMAGTLKYDKNSDCHIINIPFIESFPAAFEQLKNTLIQALESLQQSIDNLDINQLITDFRAKLDQLPMQVRDFMREIDFENKINQVKAKLDYLIDEFAITMDDLEDVMNNLRMNLEHMVMDIATKIRDLIHTVKDYVKTGNLADKITDMFSKIENQLQVFDKKYEIKHSLIKALNAIEDIIRQIDLHKLATSSAAWLRELDSKYLILEKIKDKLSEMKQAIEIFDVSMFLQDVKDYLFASDLAMYVEQISYKVPSSEIARVIESMNDVIVNWIDEYEIPHKLNAVYTYIRDLLVKYNLDDRFKQLMDQIVILIREFKIDETVQSMVDALKSINFEFGYHTIMEFLHNVTSKLRAIDFKESIDDLNEHISSTLKSMKEFDYTAFVEQTNKKITELTNYINEQIKTYEIVQKIEAVREFFREIQTSVYTYLDGLKNTKVADALKKLKSVIDTTFYNDIKMKMKDILEDMKQRIFDMDIRDEIYIYLQRVSESYSNIVAYISAQLNQLMEKIANVANDSKIIRQIKQAVAGVLDTLKTAEIKVSTFTVPLTDLVIPAFTINLNKLQEISVPAQISVPEFTILNSYKIPALTIDFDEIKAKIVAIINDIIEFEIQMPDPEDVFGDLKVLYLTELPDLTFPEITLSEIKFPVISIPTLNLKNFEITMLPIPEINLPKVPSDICIPVFGKLHGEFRVNSPYYILVTTGKIENSTSIPNNPQFTAAITSNAKSPFEPLEYTFEATAQLETPRMKKLLFTETMKASHMAFSTDHKGSLTLTGMSAEASAKTTAKATTQMYTADLVNNMALTLKSGISATIDTTYDHNMDIPSIETSSQASLKQNIAATVEPGRITVTGETTGNGKWSIQDYSDEGTHKSNAEFNINFSTAKLTFTGETDCKSLKSTQSLTAESVIFSHVTVEVKCESELPSVRKSVMLLNGEANIGELKVALTGSHDVELTGSLLGSMSNSLEFIAHPFEIVLDVKNKVNSKIFFPLKLTGKVDLQHDYGVILNSERQYACWFALARFNQYKYNHNITAENNEMDIFIHSSANGEANLDFLTVPLSIPVINIPYLEIKTPEVRDLSLWEHAGFKTFLTTPQQTFDMYLKLHYYKNPEAHSFELYLEPVYNAVSDNANIFQAQFEQFRDKVVAFLKDSYNQAKSQYIKHKIDTSSLPPRIFTVPGYKIPVLDIEVSAFRAEMPAFSYFVPKEVSTPSFKVPALGFSVPSYTLVLPSLEFPVIHVPETLSEINLPTFTLPAIQNNVVIPAMGNITCDFSFKSTMITLSANAGLYNQSDIVARFGAASTSVFDVLNGKIDGTTSLTRKRGIKLATIVSLEHNNVKANHDFAVSLTKRSMEASVANTAKINLPFFNLELNQELTGNTKTKPNVASKKKLKYMFNIPLIESAGKGNLDMNWALEALSSYVSLETSTQGKSDITIMDSCNFAGDLENEASFYLNANSLRSTVRTAFNSNIDKQEKQKRSSNNNIFQFDLNKNLALEVSLRRLFATVDYTSNNNVNFASFNTNGKHILKGELDFVPLTSLATTLNIDASQPSSLGHAGLIESVSLSLGSAKQSFTWSGKEQLASLIHACDYIVSNDESEVRMDLTESLEGHLTFLKSVKLPVYQRTLWDVLKFDQVTNKDNLQFLNISSSIVYTKSMEGQEYKIPFKLFETGVTFSIPGIEIAVPSWVREIPDSIRNIDKRIESPDVPDHFTVPPVIAVPAFDVPFTNLHVEPFTIDPKNLNIPKVITTTAFEIMLPGLPTISVPSYNVKTEYLQGRMSFLSFMMPQYEIRVSPFTLPKSFTIGDHTISLEEITTQFSNFELPTIVIPEQKIDIPEIALHLPSSVFIPDFGALSASLKVSSPIYTVSTTTNLEKKDSSLVTSLNSICTSTMIFLEYDLSASAILGFENGVMNLNGKGNLIHNDVNVDWQHVMAQNLRIKRQTPLADSTESRHTLNVDVASQTFFDANFRFASRKDGITASVSSPSSGFLGVHLQRRSMSQLYGKLFSRYLTAPEKDIDVFIAKATLKNSQKLILQTSWNWEFLHDVIEGTKDRIPAMTDAVYKFINKYHTTHFGFDLNRGSLKLKNTVSSVIERAYHEVPMSFNTLQNSIRQLIDQGKDMYMKASDSLMSMRLQNVIDQLGRKIGQVLEWTEDKIYALLNAVRQLLRDTKFTVPGSEEELSSLEMFQIARRSVSRDTDRAIQRFTSVIEKISRYIREIEFTIPGTDVVVNGIKIIDNVNSLTSYAYEQLKIVVRKGTRFVRKTVDDLIQVIGEKGENFLTYLQEENMEIASQIDAIHAEVLKSSKQHIDEAKKILAEYKDLAKLQIEEAYNLNMTRVNLDTVELINIFQSHLYGGLNEAVDLMRRNSQSTAPYFKATNKKIDIEIPLPFLWKSFSEWPKPSRH
ncbi:apolipoprotein B-100 isoform X2 [Larimichthys crocea]|uniref:apolipoprotein B-100 isoform X2 n=2 Tax=Larimichthys crocea TaxID=215358 RepID=UPI000F5F3009|nr:apolipoprotein B-100 isoform X2 [Larimichthys crocea]